VNTPVFFISSIVGSSIGNSYLIKQKFKIGILLLSLSAIIACKTHKTTCYKTNSTKSSKNKDSINNSNNNTIDNKNQPPPTCYAPPPPKK
jgi:hypothetical protein